jgi:ankyrin repeat protein
VRQYPGVCADSAATSDAVEWKTCIAGFQKDDLVLDNFASLTSAKSLIRRYHKASDKSLASALPSLELAKMFFSMIYLASNNLISDDEATSAFELLQRGNCLGLLTSLASSSLPATKAILKKFLPGAVESGNIDMVKILLSTGIDINSRFNHGFDSLLLIAVREGNLQMTKFLLEHKADARRPPGLLYAAVTTGNLQLVKLLYDSGARDETKDMWTWNQTALYSATSKGQIDIVEFLLSCGVNVNAEAGRNGETVLQAAASTGIWDLVQLILDYHPTDIYAALVHSISAGHDEIAKALIYQCIGLDRPNEKTPLQAASRRGNEELVRTLVGMGVDVNAVPKMGRCGTTGLTALQAAALSGKLEVVRFLVEKGADVNAPPAENGGMTALQAAARSGSFQAAALSGKLEVLRFLVENGADVNAPPAEMGGMTALQAAARNGSLEVVQFLLQHGADIDSDVAEDEGQSVLLAAVHTGNMKLIQFLIDEGADVNAESAWCCGHTALEAAVTLGNTELLRLLLDHKADPNAHDAEPLFAAVDTASYDIVKLLLDHGADVKRSDIDGRNVIEHMVYCGKYDFDVIELLLEHGADKTSALPDVAKSGDIDLAEFLLDSELDINATQRSGRSALVEAALAGHLKMVRLFLGYGAYDRSGALHAAVRASHPTIVGLLIRAGADVNSQHKTAEYLRFSSVLEEAAIQGNLEIIRLLLDSGADVEAKEETDGSTTRTSTRTTPLQYAAIQGHLSVVHELVRRGADVNAPAWSDDQRTALEGAAEHGRLDTVQFLINMQANVHTSRALHFAQKEGHDAVVALLMMQ